MAWAQECRAARDVVLGIGSLQQHCRPVVRAVPTEVVAEQFRAAAIDGQISCYEIKSSRDNFGRLAAQACAYSAMLDEAVLVVEGPRAAERAAGIVPPWWGIWTAEQRHGCVSLAGVRLPAPNPAPEPLAIAQLLWRDEAYAVLDRRGLSGGLCRATRWRLWERLAEGLPLDLLQRDVRDSIKARPGW